MLAHIHEIVEATLLPVNANSQSGYADKLDGHIPVYCASRSFASSLTRTRAPIVFALRRYEPRRYRFADAVPFAEINETFSKH